MYSLMVNSIKRGSQLSPVVCGRVKRGSKGCIFEASMQKGQNQRQKSRQSDQFRSKTQRLEFVGDRQNTTVQGLIAECHTTQQIHGANQAENSRNNQEDVEQEIDGDRGTIDAMR